LAAHEGEKEPCTAASSERHGLRTEYCAVESCVWRHDGARLRNGRGWHT
jgi:hypothetical protein